MPILSFNKFVAISETKTKITYKSRHPHIGHVLHLVLNTISSGNKQEDGNKNITICFNLQLKRLSSRFAIEVLLQLERKINL